ALLLLAGCQQTAHQPAPPLQAQLDHIALMLAGGHFLRVDCGRSEIPDDVKLQRTQQKFLQRLAIVQRILRRKLLQIDIDIHLWYAKLNNVQIVTLPVGMKLWCQDNATNEQCQWLNAQSENL
ncbi:hypothetical protein ACOS17_04660, partial [Serratia sp. CY43514]